MGSISSSKQILNCKNKHLNNNLGHNQIFFILLTLGLLFANPTLSKGEVTKYDTNAVQLCHLAYEVASRGDYNAALVYLNRSLEIEPRFPEALFNLGSISKSQGKYEDAYAAFQRLLYINPADYEARLEKVSVLISMQNFKAAQEELNEVPENQERYKSVKERLEEAAEKSNQKSLLESNKVDFQVAPEKQITNQNTQHKKSKAKEISLSSKDLSMAKNDNKYIASKNSTVLQSIETEKNSSKNIQKTDANKKEISRLTAKKALSQQSPNLLNTNSNLIKTKTNQNTNEQIKVSQKLAYLDPAKGLYSKKANNIAENIDEIKKSQEQLFAENLFPPNSFNDSVANPFAQISIPTGITVDSQKNIYVANFSNNTIEKLSSNGTNKNILASGALISGPSGLIYDTQRQRLLVSNYISGTIVSIDLNGKSRLLVSDLQKPYSLFLEEQSNQLYVSEQGKKVVSIIDLNSVSN